MDVKAGAKRETRTDERKRERSGEEEISKLLEDGAAAVALLWLFEAKKHILFMERPVCFCGGVGL